MDELDNLDVLGTRETVNSKRRYTRLTRTEIRLDPPIYAISHLIYKDGEGRKYEYDDILGSNLDFFNAFLVTSHPLDWIPETIEGKVEFENERFLGIKVGDGMLKDIRVKDITYRFAKIRNTGP